MKNEQPVLITLKSDNAASYLVFLLLYFVLFFNFNESPYDLYDAIMKYLLQ